MICKYCLLVFLIMFGLGVLVNVLVQVDVLVDIQKVGVVCIGVLQDFVFFGLVNMDL